MEKNKKNIVELTEKISGDKWKDALKKSFDKNSKKIKMDGFRPGKVPYDMYIFDVYTHSSILGRRHALLSYPIHLPVSLTSLLSASRYQEQWNV